MGDNCRSLLISLIGSSILLSPLALGQSVEECRQESNDRARLACYDALFESIELTSEVTKDEVNEATAVENTSVGSTAPPVEATMIAVEPLVSQVEAAEIEPVIAHSEVTLNETDATVDDVVVARAQEAYDEVIANAQTLIVSDVRRNSRRQVFFATEQGRTFRRESGSYASFKEGDQLSIETGMMSSMFLVNQDGLRIKVKEL